MKTLIVILSVLISGSAFAAKNKATVRCSYEVTRQGEKPKTYWSVARSGNFEHFWDHCEGSLADGTTCFTGKRFQVLDLLEEMENADILGDEYSITHISYVGKDQVGYTVHDGPNENDSRQHISRCGK